MEEEFDPDKFSKIMDEAYGEDFYGEEDIAWKSDKDVKQSMAKDNEDLLLEGEYYDYDNEDLHNDGNDDNNDDEGRKDDADMYDTEIEEDYYYAEEELEENSLDRQLKQKMLDELYKLDYEDIIGDMPCRFKYRHVEPNSYGLSCEEILFANDTALKQFVSLKSMNPYRENVSLFGASNGCSVMSEKILIFFVFYIPKTME
jgi:protein KRI1